VQHVFFDVEHLSALPQLVDRILNLTIIFALNLQIFQGFEGVGVGLVKVPVFQLSMGQLTVDLKLVLPLIHLRLIVLNTPVVILGQQQHIAVIFDLFKGLQAVTVILDDCLFAETKSVGLGPE
jgi:hypothetical protein